jgi:uncharacterized protein
LTADLKPDIMARAMLSETMPQRVDPLKWAHKRGVIQASLCAADFPELREEPYALQSGELQVALRFEFDTNQRCVVQGHVQGHVALECARCLKPVMQDLDSHFSLCAVANDAEAEKLASLDYDSILMENGEVFPFAIVQEELILNFPQVAKHPEGACYSLHEATVAEFVNTKAKEVTKNPFSQLNKLLYDEP